MNRLKAFLLGSLKIAAALFLVVVALLAVAFGWEAIKENRRKAAEAPLALPKNWPIDKIEPLDNLPLKLATKWRDGRLYYQFSADGYPRALEFARAQAKNDRFGFTIEFHDEGGFKVFQHHIPLRSMKLIVGADGRGKGLDDNNDVAMSADNYRNAAKWETTWNFPTAIEERQKPVDPASATTKPKPSTPAAKWRDISLWRQLNKSMTQAQVQELLGPPTKVDSGGALTFWYYGYPLGGEVSFNERGTIYGWSEPHR